MVLTMKYLWFYNRPTALSGNILQLNVTVSTGTSVADSQTAPSTASVCFHPHCGSLIKLSNNNRTAERQRPTEEFKNAVTLTNVPLRNDEMFEVSGQ